VDILDSDDTEDAAPSASQQLMVNGHGASTAPEGGPCRE